MTNLMENYFRKDRSKILLTDANIIATNIANYMDDKNKFDYEIEKK